MGSVAFAFFGIPAITAIVIGYFVSDWRLAGAIAAGGFGLLFLLPQLGPPFVFALPAVSGAAVAGLALSPFLRFVEEPTVWGRMTVALIAALVVGGLLLMVVSGGR